MYNSGVNSQVSDQNDKVVENIRLPVERCYGGGKSALKYPPVGVAEPWQTTGFVTSAWQPQQYSDAVAGGSSWVDSGAGSCTPLPVQDTNQWQVPYNYYAGGYGYDYSVTSWSKMNKSTPRSKFTLPIASGPRRVGYTDTFEPMYGYYVGKKTEDYNIETIDGREAARKYGNVTVSTKANDTWRAPVVDSREAAKKYSGKIV